MRDKLYYVYIMGSRSLNLYIGMGRDLRLRVWEHKHGESDFTSRYRIHRLLYYESSRYVLNCIHREKQLKRWSRAKKLALIRSMNPGLLDLAADWFEDADPSTASLRDSARDDNS